MTPRPQHARGLRVGAHRAPRDAGRTVARAGQFGAAVLVGGLTLGLAVHDLDTHRTPGPAPAAATPGPVAEPVPVDRVPVPLATGTVDPAEDPGAVTPLGPTVTVEPPATPLTPPERVGLDLTTHSTSDPASVWVVVNKALPLEPADFAPDDLTVVAGYQVRAVVQEPLGAMLAAASAEGVRLELRSGYRSSDYQAAVHADWAAQVGQERTDEVSARPGHSEHQTGLAVDVGSGSDPACDFEACFDQTPEGQWVAARAADFGFLVRYTEQTQEVTGFAPEGWHLRYVGTDLVAEMERRGVATLEELFGLPGGTAYR